jgi:S-adenosylmethionine decarboxylase
MLQLSDVEDVSALDDPEQIGSFLSRMVAGIGMRILDGPHTKTELVDDARYGHSGVVLLYESHAAIHTYPARRSLFLDVFSCKLFDVRSVVEISHETFGDFNIAESTVLDRGHHWDANVEIELGRWLESR